MQDADSHRSGQDPFNGLIDDLPISVGAQGSEGVFSKYRWDLR